MVPVCGTCSDAVLKMAWWWVTASHAVFPALLVQALVVAMWPKNPKSRFGAIALSLGVFTASLMFGGGGEIGLWLGSLVLLISMAVSVRRDAQLPRWSTHARVTLVALALIVGLVRARPSQRETEELVDVVTIWPTPRTWIDDELRTRADAREFIEREMRMNGNTRLVELHRELGFPAEGRRFACDRFRTDERAKYCPGE